MSDRTATRHLALLLAAGAAAACAGPTPPPDAAAAVLERGPRDVVLVTVDTLRWDATGFSGAGHGTTPAMDRLAAAGVVFERAHAHAVLTLPSHASILTGLHPHEHGIRDNGGFVLDRGLPSLPTILRDAGFATAAFVSAFPLDRRFGLASGFDLYDDRYQGGAGLTFAVSERPDADTAARAGDWWIANAGRPRFVWLHLFGPHTPYEPAEPHASRFPESPYLGEVAAADAVLGSFLERIQEPEGAGPLVVLTADHGEALGEHGEATHGLLAYESTLRVPLVLAAPGMLAPSRHARQARHIDLLPTVLDLLGLEAPSALPGRALFAANASASVDDGVYFEALSGALDRGWAPLVGRIEDGMKAIRLPQPELYDLAQDPNEERNLAAKRPGLLDEILSRLPDAGTAIRRDPLDEEVAARLRALGYLAGSPADTPDPDEAADPKQRIASQGRLDQADALYWEGRVDEALSALRGLIADYPRMTLAYKHLGFMLLDGGRVDDAVELLTRAAGLGVTDASIRTLLAYGLARRGEAARAWELLVVDAESPDPEIQRALGSIAAKLGRLAEARARFERALELDATYPEAELELGLLAAREGRLAAARPHLERAVDANPRLALGWNALGVVRAEAGELRGAVQAWRRAHEADPRMPDPLINAARALDRLGDSGEAIRALELYLPLVEGERRERAAALLAALRERDTPGG